MHTVIITGASRGIGCALAHALASPERQLILLARDTPALDALCGELQAQGAHARALPCDLSSLQAAREAGARLLEQVADGAVLVHNAGIWPARLTLTSDGLERAFVVNHLAALALQGPLLARRRLSRIMSVNAGLIGKGRFDAQRTPYGADFSALGTYCNTKLCFALAMRALAREHPELDVLVLHPGVVRTQLGARSGPLGLLLSLAKRFWEQPEQCAQRLARILALPRWSEPGQAGWYVEETPSPWPEVARDEALIQAVWENARSLLARLD